VIGVGQVTARHADPRDTEPMELWAQACALALNDAGASRRARLDSLSVVRSDSWSYDSPAQRLAEHLGVTPLQLVDAGIGGTQPQAMVHTACEAIARGRMDLALVVSGEALHTVDVVARDGRTPPWRYPAPAPPPVHLDDFFHKSEIRHGMLPIMRSFALRDMARRAHLGRAVGDYAAEPAPTYAAMSRVAAANPFAWHRSAKSPEEILRVGTTNRRPVHPYPKFVMASPKVNQAAALLLASHARAQELGVPSDHRVYVRGWSSASDYPYVAQNEDLWRSRAMERAARAALEASGLGVDDLDYFDLYSCFPSSVRFAVDALGLALSDPRGVTVTGGMPYAGAPGSGYVTHAIAAMATKLRERPGSAGVVSGLSAQMATHAFSVFSTLPGVGDPGAFGATHVGPDPGEQVTIVAEGRGPAVLEAYAVACSPDGTDELAVAVCRLPDNSRCYAQTRGPALLEWLSQSEGVGHGIALEAGEDGRNQFMAR
jgi:acetyl-CoA C-acetyltransferase